MPLRGRGGFFVLTCYLAQPLQTETVFDFLWVLQQHFELPITTQPVNSPGAATSHFLTHLDEPQFISYCQKQWQAGQETIAKHPELALQESVTIQFGIPQQLNTAQPTEKQPKPLSFSLTVAHYQSGVQTLICMLNLGERDATNAHRVFQQADHVMKLFVHIGRFLVKQLLPDYLWIAEDDVSTWHIDPTDVRKHRLQTIYWVNYFDQTYLGERANQLILDMPVGQVRNMERGMWLQLHPQFEDVPIQIVTQIEQQAQQHLAPLEIERVQWKFA